MTFLDGFLIVVGIAIVIVCAMEGVLRALVGLLAFYLIVSGMGMVVLATNMLRGLAVSISQVAGSTSVPSLISIQTITFAGLTFPLFIFAHIVGKALFPETTLPEIKILDNILGLLVGVVLALVVMSVIYGTWGAAVSVQWQNRQAWNSMKIAYVYAFLRPLMGTVLSYFRPTLVLFSLTGYPPFFRLY